MSDSCPGRRSLPPPFSLSAGGRRASRSDSDASYFSSDRSISLRSDSQADRSCLNASVPGADRLTCSCFGRRHLRAGSLLPLGQPASASLSALQFALIFLLQFPEVSGLPAVAGRAAAPLAPLASAAVRAARPPPPASAARGGSAGPGSRASVQAARTACGLPRFQPPSFSTARFEARARACSFAAAPARPSRTGRADSRISLRNSLALERAAPSHAPPRPRRRPCPASAVLSGPLTAGAHLHDRRAVPCRPPGAGAPRRPRRPGFPRAVRLGRDAPLLLRNLLRLHLQFAALAAGRRQRPPRACSSARRSCSAARDPFSAAPFAFSRRRSLAAERMLVGGPLHAIAPAPSASDAAPAPRPAAQFRLFARQLLELPLRLLGAQARVGQFALTAAQVLLPLRQIANAIERGVLRHRPAPASPRSTRDSRNSCAAGAGVPCRRARSDPGSIGCRHCRCRSPPATPADA